MSNNPSPQTRVRSRILDWIGTTSLLALFVIACIAAAPIKDIWWQGQWQNDANAGGKSITNLHSVTASNTITAGQFNGSGAGLSTNTVPHWSLSATNAPAVGLIYRTDGTNGYWATMSGGGGSGDLLAANNLSDLASLTTGRTNLGAHDAANLTTGYLAAGRFATNTVSPWALAATNSPSAGKFYVFDAGTSGYWTTPSGAGTVTSVDVAISGMSSSGAITSSGTITMTGQLALSRGGTGADLSATGGTGQILKQNSSGGTITVGTLDYADLSNKDAELTALAGLSSAADKLPYFTGSGAASLTDLTSTARSLLDDSSTSAMRTTLGLAIGTDVQGIDAELTSLAGLTSAANKIPYYTGSGTAALADYTASARALDALTIAKGTIYVGTGSGTATALAVGSNDQVLTADSSQSSGVKWADAGSASVDPAVANVRLSLSSTLAIPTTDVTAATTVYLHPFKGGTISLYSGSAWVSRTLGSSALSLSISAYTANTNYDVFVYDNGGTPTLETAGWTNATTRATALTLQDGVYVKSGSTTRRYVGTFRITGTTGQSEDSTSKRFCWSMYNRVRRLAYSVETTDSGQYDSATPQELFGGATIGQSRIQYICGVSEDLVEAHVKIDVTPSATSTAATGVGVDSTSVNSAQLFGSSIVFGAYTTLTGTYSGYPGIGMHTLSQLHWSDGNAAVYWYGDNGSTTMKSGMRVYLMQ